MAVTAALMAAPASAQQATTAPAVDVTLKLLRDGDLAVTETVRAPAGQELVRRVPLRVPADGARDRRYTVADPVVQGEGTAEVTGDQFVLKLRGEATVSYRVTGAVADLQDQQQVRWQLASGWETGLGRIGASFVAPVQRVSAIDCFAGPLGSDRRCTLAATAHSGVIQVDQDGLAAGERVDLAVGLPAGTVPPNARFEAVAAAGAFAFGTADAIGLGVLLALLLAGLGFLWWLRRRDAGARTAGAGQAGADAMLLRDGDRVFFASPDGVLPGQVGTVIDETVDTVDISATVVDLAVRNYLWIAELTAADGGTDWQLSRRNAPDERLHEFERAVVDALLPGGGQTVLLSQLGKVDLAPVRAAMYADVVRQRWFSRHPGTARNPLTLAGAVLAGAGVLVTVVLALSVGHALLGVGLVVAGLVLAAASRLLPTRTARGRLLAGQVRGLLGYLGTVRADDVPPADRELVFSRSLPYAVVLGVTERWLAEFARLDPAADGSAGLYWFGGLEGDCDLTRFATHFPSFLTALNAALTTPSSPSPVPA
ncbi:DUF2207 domain-containing protein [Amycolatopsis nigrescens]|uniref:DUF2207 domain-containing protein n=1 Tax=Amycolatopsis nigrescens TaxID=381445 RepID=UPI001FE0C011|nr:DUF2207 domain-containing protein [Amycolatopsis nigrescens]